MQLIRRLKLDRHYVGPPDTIGEYVFITRNNICAAEVDDEDVPRILAIKESCCGNTSKRTVYRILGPDEAPEWYRS
jgi:hypothetical protein